MMRTLRDVILEVAAEQDPARAEALRRSSLAHLEVADSLWTDEQYYEWRNARRAARGLPPLTGGLYFGPLGPLGHRQESPI